MYLKGTVSEFLKDPSCKMAMPNPQRHLCQVWMIYKYL